MSQWLLEKCREFYHSDCLGLDRLLLIDTIRRVSLFRTCEHWISVQKHVFLHCSPITTYRAAMNTSVLNTFGSAMTFIYFLSSRSTHTHVRIDNKYTFSCEIFFVYTSSKLTIRSLPEKKAWNLCINSLDRCYWIQCLSRYRFRKSRCCRSSGWWKLCCSTKSNLQFNEIHISSIYLCSAELEFSW